MVGWSLSRAGLAKKYKTFRPSPDLRSDALAVATLARCEAGGSLDRDVKGLAA
jgi:hypothetical protein